MCAINCVLLTLILRVPACHKHGMELVSTCGSPHVLHLHQLCHVGLVYHSLAHGRTVHSHSCVQTPQQLTHAAHWDAEGLHEQQKLGRVKVNQSCDKGNRARWPGYC